jgi:hypothetical protein
LFRGEKAEITMVKRKRSFSLSEPRLCVSQHRVLRNRADDAGFKRYAKETFPSGDIRDAVLDLIVCCTPGVWLRILPLDDDSDSLCFHTGQEWADVQSCLQECGLVTTPGHIGGTLSAPIREWEHFAGASDGKLEVSTARRLGGKASLFVMRRPTKWEEGMYKCPIDQLNDSQFQVPRSILSPSEERLRRYFRHCRIHLLSEPMQEAVAAINATPAPSGAGVPPTVGVATIDAGTAPIDGSAAPMDDHSASMENDSATPTNTDVVPRGAPITVTPAEKRQLCTNDEFQLDELGSMWETAITTALSLDFQTRPRPSRNGTGIVELHDRIHADHEHRLLSIYTATAWGWSNLRFDYITRQRIAEAACRQVSYDFGYKQPIAYSRLPHWKKELDEYQETGDKAKVVGNQRAGRVSYLSRIEDVKKTYDPESLARSVERAWDKRLNPIAFSRVADRLLKVLDLIVEDDGDNNLVESQRGKLFSDPVYATADGVAEASDTPEVFDFVVDTDDE